LLACAREERLRLLRLTDKCWIPLQVAEALKQEGEPYIDEVEIAAACGESGDEVQQLLAAFYVQAAYDRLSQLGVTARSVREKRALMREVEEQLLPKICGTVEAGEVRSRLEAERARLRDETARAELEKRGRYDGCTDLLATIQWNIAREEEYFEQEDEFKEACCGFLMANTSGWLSWMRSRPERERLADAEIENKRKLMKRYCAPQGD
jgi:hypothetical protein